MFVNVEKVALNNPYSSLQHMGDFEEFVRDVIDVLTHEEQNRLYEMELWIMNNEGVWVLDDTFIAFLGRVLHDAKSFTSDNRVTFLRLLAYGAEQEDFSMITHMDRSTHHIMNYAKDFESLPILEQEALALLVRIPLTIVTKKFLFVKKSCSLCSLPTCLRHVLSGYCTFPSGLWATLPICLMSK